MQETRGLRMGGNPWEAPQLTMVNGEPVSVEAMKKKEPPIEEGHSSDSPKAETVESKVMEFDGFITVKGRRLMWERTDGSVCLQYQDRLTNLGAEQGIMWLYTRHLFSADGVPLNYDGIDALGLEGARKLQKFVGELNKKHVAVELDDERIQIGQRILSCAKLNDKLNSVSGYLQFQQRFAKDPLKMTAQAIGYFDIEPKELTFWECQALINFLYQQLVGVESEEEETDPEQN